MTRLEIFHHYMKNKFSNNVDYCDGNCRASTPVDCAACRLSTKDSDGGKDIAGLDGFGGDE